MWLIINGLRRCEAPLNASFVVGRSDLFIIVVLLLVFELTAGVLPGNHDFSKGFLSMGKYLFSPVDRRFDIRHEPGPPIFWRAVSTGRPKTMGA